MLNIDPVVVDQGQARDRPAAKRMFGRSGPFVFGVVPAETWRAPNVAWVMIGLSVVLLFVGWAIRHWSWQPGGFDASVPAAAAGIGGNVLLFAVMAGLTIAWVRRLRASSDRRAMRCDVHRADVRQALRASSSRDAVVSPCARR